MKFTPKELKTNVNISSVSPIRDFFELLLKLLGLLLLLYILLGIAVGYIAPRVPIDMELKIGKLFSRQLEPKSKAEEQIQPILDELVKNASLPKFNYSVRIVEDSKYINAGALPGGNIVISCALLKEIKSKNELAMILAHELGHFAHRDHLRGLGRSLVFLLLSSITFGADSSISKFIANSITNVEMRFSQTQEKAADIYALDLLNETYGNVAGAVDFFEKMANKEKISRFLYVFASHPYTKDRISTIQEIIKERGYNIQEKIPIEIMCETKNKF